MTKQKTKVGNDVNPAVFIANFIENGLKREKKEIVKVNRVAITLKTSEGDFLIEWEHPFKKMHSQKIEST
ncbi:MAG: hypothetical protein HC880_05105 [Bacteroidia bacterium]|nr:hypothetical protein [Bacteroidia bacterium]